MSLSRKSKIILPVAVVIVIADRVTKYLVSHNFEPGQSMTVVPGFFDLTYVHNTGAAFGIFSMMDDMYRVPVLALSSLAAIALLAYFVVKTPPGETIMLTAIAMIIGGAAGNLYDRLSYGYVVDFVDWYVGNWHWPAFNIADSGITVGIILLGEELIIRNRMGDPE